MARAFSNTYGTDAWTHAEAACRCSFVQIYREQAYDLLNAAALAAAAAAGAGGASGGPATAAAPPPNMPANKRTPPGAGAALKLRCACVVLCCVGPRRAMLPRSIRRVLPEDPA